MKTEDYFLAHRKLTKFIHEINRFRYPNSWDVTRVDVSKMFSNCANFKQESLIGKPLY